MHIIYREETFFRIITFFEDGEYTQKKNEHFNFIRFVLSVILLKAYVHLSHSHGHSCGKTKVPPSIGVDKRLVSGVLQAKSSLPNARETDELKLECLCDRRLLSNFQVSLGNVTQVVCQFEP